MGRSRSARAVLTLAAYQPGNLRAERDRASSHAMQQSQLLSQAHGPTGPAWDEGIAVTEFPRLHGDCEADVCVVGLGGSGLSCIHELLRLGQRVVGLDAGTVGGCAAGRNGGFLLGGAVTFYHDTAGIFGRDRARALYQATLDQIDRMENETSATVRRTGSLRIAASVAEELDCELQLNAMLADGFQVSSYTGPEGVGLLFPQDAAFNPLDRCRSLAHTVAEAGASLFEHSHATSISGSEVRTESGLVRCRHAIVAVDGNLERVLPELVGRVRTARLQMLATAPAPEANFTRPVYRRWGYDYWQQLPDRRIVLGGCRDRFENAEWTTDASPTREVQDCMDKILRTTLGVTQPVQRRWAASVGYSDGVLPVFDQVRPDVWAMGGYSGTGNVVGAIYGRMAAQIVATGSSDLASTFAPALNA